MHTHSDFQNKPDVSWRRLVGLTVGILALGWWAFRPGEIPQESAPPAAQARLVAPLHAPTPQSTRQIAHGTPENIYRTAGKDELLGFLRKKLSGPDKEVLAALEEIAQSRPELAVDLVQQLGRTDQERATWIKDIVKQWADRDPQQAWDWLTQQTEKLANGFVIGVVFDAMAASEPERLVKDVDALLRPDNNDNNSGAFAPLNVAGLGLQALIKNGHLDLAQAAVEAWANDPLKPQIGTAAYETVARAMDKTTPESTGVWLRSLPVSEDRNSALGTFAFSWGESDPTAAMRWAETLTAQEGRSDIVSRIFSEWTKSDTNSAMNWLDDYMARNPAFVGDDVMIGSLVLFSSTTKNDPDKALKLADLISDPKIQAVYVAQVFQAWGHRDPAAAIDYLQKSPTIDLQQKQQLIQQIQAAQSSSSPEQ